MKKNLLIASGGIFLGTFLGFALAFLYWWPSDDPYGGRPHATISVNHISLSPRDGKFILAFNSLHYNGLFLFDERGRVQEIIGINGSSMAYLQSAFAPKKNKIAFTAGPRKGPLDIYLINIDSRKISKLIHGNRFSSNPTFSPQGDNLFFVRHTDTIKSEGQWLSEGDIYCYALSTKNEHRITKINGIELFPIYVFPDGNHLLFKTDALQKNGHMLWVVDALNPEKLKPLIPDLREFAKEPRLVFYKHMPSEHDPHKTIKTIDYAYYEIRDFALSQDGKTLAFSWSNPEEPFGRLKEGYQLYITDMTTKRSHKLTSLPHGAYVNAISPDGKIIYFTTLATYMDFGQVVFPETGLWRINADGTGLAPVSLDFSGLVGKQPWITDNQALLAMKAVSQP